MADTKFMNFAEVTPALEDSVLVANAANGVRRSTLAKIKDAIIAAMGIRYNLEQNGYLCMGALFGNLKIQWGYVSGETVTTPDQVAHVTLPVDVSKELFSCGNVNVDAGNKDENWKNNHVTVSTMYNRSSKKLSVSSTLFGKAYWVQWLLIGV